MNFIFQEGLAIEDVTSFEGVRIFPNPSNGNYAVEFGKQLNYVTATLRNSVGQLVSVNTYDLVYAVQINIDGPAGIYFLELETANGSGGVFRLVKE